MKKATKIAIWFHLFKGLKSLKSWLVTSDNLVIKTSDDKILSFKE